MSFNRPDPSKELRERAYEIIESVGEDTSVFWNEFDAAIIGETRVWNLYQDDDSIVVLCRDFFGSNGWEEWEDGD